MPLRIDAGQAASGDRVRVVDIDDDALTNPCRSEKCFLEELHQPEFCSLIRRKRLRDIRKRNNDRNIARRRSLSTKP